MAEPTINYGSKTYAEIKADLIAAIDTFTPEWTDRSDTDMGIVLLQLMAMVGDLCMFHLNVLANESLFDTAEQKTSMFSMAKMLSYPVKSSTPAQTRQVFTLTAPAAVPFTVPKGTQVKSKTQPDLVFETTADLVIPQGALGNEMAGLSPAYSVLVKHMKQVVHEVLGSIQPRTDGSVDFLAFTLENKDVIKTEITVEVYDGASWVVWTQAEAFVDAGAADKIYTVTIDGDGYAEVKFGNGVIGAIPPVGSNNVRVSYGYGGGLIGNGLPAGDLSEMAQSIPLIKSTTSFDITSGGSDVQTPDEVRKLMPEVWATLRRAVTLPDYVALSRQYADITDVAVRWNDEFDQVRVYPLHSNGQLFTNSEKSDLRNYLLARAMIGTNLMIWDPYYVDCDIKMTVKPLPNYTPATVQANVIAAIDDLFAFSNRDLGQSEYLSELYKLAELAEGVSYLNIEKFTRIPTAVPAEGNAGKGVFTEIIVNAATLAKTWTLKMTDATHFQLTSGAQVEFGQLGTEVDITDMKFTMTADPADAPDTNDTWTIKTSNYLGNVVVSDIEILRRRTIDVQLA